MITPLGKKILVKPQEVKAGILLVAGAKPSRYDVFAIGDEVSKVKVGDTIYLEKHYGTEIEHEKDKFLVIDETSILAKLSISN
jgi:chaperonin GroES